MINKAYFKRFFNESLYFLMFLSFILCLISAVQFTIISFDEYSIYTTYQTTIIPTMIAISLSPLYIFNYRTSKRKCDVYYSLPISKNSLFNTRTLVTFLDILIAFTLAFLINCLFFIAKSSGINGLHYVYSLPLYFLSILAFIPLFLLSIITFNLGNTRIDGLIIQYSYLVTVPLIILCIFYHSQVSSDVAGVIYSCFKANYFITFNNSIFDYLILGDHYEGLKINLVTGANSSLIPVIVLFILSAGLFVLFEFKLKKEKAERIGQISSSILAYKTIIILLTASIGCGLSYLVFVGFGVELTLVFLSSLIISFYVLYVIYKRTFRIKKDVLPLLIISFALSIGFFCLGFID